VENLATAKRRLSLTSAAVVALGAALVFYGGLYFSLDLTASTMLRDIDVHMAKVAKEAR
jgi:type VI secretion system protein ImpK